jgi:3-methylcrotonyl-CoA carboxylase alpha subunit
MEKAGVPTTPGYYGDDTQEPEQLMHEAVKIGFPLLIKAIMGGGGKGMRLVLNEGEFLEKLESCQRESLNSFGDSRVLLEKYLAKPRHVEVQVVADHHGHVVHLHERDCSLQRRHQKIIEEAPASYLPNELREQLGEMGKRAAEAVGYVNAGPYYTSISAFPLPVCHIIFSFRCLLLLHRYGGIPLRYTAGRQILFLRDEHSTPSGTPHY